MRGGHDATGRRLRRPWSDGRGDVMHDDALIEAPRSGKLSATGLDVFASEPNVDACDRNARPAAGITPPRLAA